MEESNIHPIVLLPDEPGDARARLEREEIETYAVALNRLRATRSLRVHGQLIRGALQQVKLISRLIEDLDIDLVQIHGITCIDGAAAARAQKKPLVWQIIDTRAPRLLRRAVMPYVRRSKAIVMTTGTALQGEFPGLDALAERTVSFYPPVDTTEFSKDRDLRVAARSTLDVADSSKLLVSLGNLNPQKGLESLLTAFGEIRLRHPNTELRVRGSESRAHPGYLQRLKSLAIDRGLPVGTVSVLEGDLTPAGFLNAGDLFLMAPAGRSEGIPTVILEAMSLGLPIIATDVGGISEVVGQDSGTLVIPGNEGALVAAIERWLVVPKAKVDVTAIHNRKYVEENCCIERSVNAHIRAYELAEDLPR